MFVVVFDDNLLTSASLIEQLQRGRHEAVVATTIAQARRTMPRRPDAVLINLRAMTFDPPALILALRADPAFTDRSLVGFCGHLERLRRTRALEAGCDHVITNSQALKHLNETLARLSLRPD